MTSLEDRSPARPDSDDQAQSCPSPGRSALSRDRPDLPLAVNGEPESLEDGRGRRPGMHQGQFRAAVPCIRHPSVYQCSVDPAASELRDHRCPPEPGDIADEGVAASTCGRPVPAADEVTRGRPCEGPVDVLLGRRGIAPGLRTGAFVLGNIVSRTYWSRRGTPGRRVDRERVVERVPADVDGLVNARAPAREYPVDPGG
jgi:hypothetical protein